MKSSSTCKVPFISSVVCCSSCRRAASSDAGRRIFEQEIHEADRTEEGVGDVVRDVRCQLAERGCPGERDEQAFDGRPAVVRKGQ